MGDDTAAMSTFELDLEIMAHGGAAMGRYEGRVIFVPYAIPGERVRARITEDKERFAHAEPVEILDPSPDREEPSCPHFGVGLCGGCQWQHITYPAQLAFKQAVMADQLQRVGKIQEPPVQPPLPGPSPWGYRCHMTFTASEEGWLGFWSANRESLIPIEMCHILDPDLMTLFAQLDLDAPEITRVRFQIGSDPDDVMLVLETEDDLPPEITLDFPASVNFLLSDNEPVNLIGKSHVSYDILGRSFRVTAGGFFQANPPVAEMLVHEVLDRIDLRGDETALDLYGGVGLFSAFLAERAGLVISVESYPPAATDAEVNLADFDNVDIIEGSVEDVLPDLDGPIDVAVVDPPRTGLDVKVVDELERLGPPTLVYVSCDPATLARDSARLIRKGYRLLDVQPVDMFPQTFHIEAVALFGQ
jgi:23S rRNA (uracil1939-C5)-methyltransferase